MKIKITEVTTKYSSRVYYNLEDAPLVSFGQAGMLSPYRASVERDSYHNQTGERTFHSIRVALSAKNANDVQFRGAWGWPHPAKPIGWEQDYGHYGSGRIKELPEELRHELGVFV